MNNGTRKGGAPQAFRVLHESPGLEDLWQLHWSHNTGLDNAPALFVANIDDNATVGSVLTASPRANVRGRQGSPSWRRRRGTCPRVSDQDRRVSGRDVRRHQHPQRIPEDI